MVRDYIKDMPSTNMNTDEQGNASIWGLWLWLEGELPYEKHETLEMGLQRWKNKDMDRCRGQWTEWWGWWVSMGINCCHQTFRCHFFNRCSPGFISPQFPKSGNTLIGNYNPTASNHNAAFLAPILIRYLNALFQHSNDSIWTCCILLESPNGRKVLINAFVCWHENTVPEKKDPLAVAQWVWIQTNIDSGSLKEFQIVSISQYFSFYTCSVSFHL